MAQDAEEAYSYGATIADCPSAKAMNHENDLRFNHFSEMQAIDWEWKTHEFTGVQYGVAKPQTDPCFFALSDNWLRQS
jgi:hypothetical protein